MSDTEMTCSPHDGILTIPVDTVAALDRIAATLPANTPWLVVVHLPAATLTIRPAHHREAHQ
ncbi:MAG: hypothetical protein HIU88_10155 [Acidobacteria bacterium]|nr:hypothetical protein [Acidobacteriota bacterium]